MDVTHSYLQSSTKNFHEVTEILSRHVLQVKKTKTKFVQTRVCKYRSLLRFQAKRFRRNFSVKAQLGIQTFHEYFLYRQSVYYCWKRII